MNKGAIITFTLCAAFGLASIIDDAFKYTSVSKFNTQSAQCRLSVITTLR